MPIPLDLVPYAHSNYHPYERRLLQYCRTAILLGFGVTDANFIAQAAGLQSVGAVEKRIDLFTAWWGIVRVPGSPTDYPNRVYVANSTEVLAYMACRSAGGCNPCDPIGELINWKNSSVVAVNQC